MRNVSRCQAQRVSGKAICKQPNGCSQLLFVKFSKLLSNTYYQLCSAVVIECLNNFNNSHVEPSLQRGSAVAAALQLFRIHKDEVNPTSSLVNVPVRILYEENHNTNIVHGTIKLDIESISNKLHHESYYCLSPLVLQSHKPRQS